MGIRWNFRLRPGLGRFHANISKRGLRSVSITLIKKWLTWNPKRHTFTIDTPGPGSATFSYGESVGRRSTGRRRP